MRASKIFDWRAHRVGRRALAALALVLGLGAVAGGGTALASKPQSPEQPVITITGFAFQGDLTVLAGVTVTVRNADTVVHTLTAADGSFTTPTIQPGGSATFTAPKTLGNYAITCRFHPSMTGTLTVGVPPPAKPVITIRNFGFEGDLTVRPGSLVTVRNADTVMHTLTAVDGSFTTRTIRPGRSATFTAPKTLGKYPITCRFHPSMTGTLTVATIVTPPPPTGPVITIKDFAFQVPPTVEAGVTVTVRNEDPVVHDVADVDGSFRTPPIQPGTSATFDAPKQPGTYPFVCTFHGGMTGTLMVVVHH